MSNKRDSVWTIEVRRKATRHSGVGPWVTVMLFNVRREALKHSKYYRRTHRVVVSRRPVN